jgi:hypothetical protein
LTFLRSSSKLSKNPGLSLARSIRKDLSVEKLYSFYFELNRKEWIMSGLVKFLIRAVVGAGLAVLMSRFFFRRLSLFTVLIAIFLVGMAYLSEYARRRDP